MHYIKKTTTIWLLMATMLLQGTLCDVALAQDYQEHSARQAIQEGVDQGLIELTEGDFRPDEDISRVEWVRLLNAYLSYYRLSSEGFGDVEPEDNYYEDFLIAKEAGLVTGDEENQVYPTDGVSREEALSTVVNALAGEVPEAPLILIQDGEDIRGELENQVRYAVSEGWFPLDTENYLKPSKNLTRAQAVEILDAATGIRLVGETSFGNALDTSLVEENICIYSPESMLQRLESAKNIYVLPTASTRISLNKVRLDGTLVVLGAGDLTIELKDSTIALLETRNPYGTVEVVRDSRSSIGNFKQGTPLELAVQEEKVEETVTRTPQAVRWLAIGFVCLLLGMVLYQARDKTKTLFISKGVAKYVPMPEVENWKHIGILNPQSQIVEVAERKGKIRIEGLEEGRAHVELYQMKEPTAATQLDGTEHAHMRKSRKGRVFLNIVVVKGKED